MPFALQVFSFVDLSVRPNELALAVEDSQLPLSFVAVSVGICQLSVAVALVIVKGSLVQLPVMKEVNSVPVFSSVTYFSFKTIAVCVGFCPAAMR